LEYIITTLIAKEIIMNLNVFAPVTNCTSYGLVSINLLRHLKDNYDITLFTTGQVTVDDEQDKYWLKTCIDRQEDIDQTAPYIRIYHQFDLASRIGRGFFVGFPIFELTHFNKRELGHLKTPDILVVASHWAKEIIKNELGIEAKVVPLGVDTNIFDYKRPIPENLKPTKPTCIFLNIGKWEYRKGHDFLINCFVKAFNHSDSVELWLCPHNFFINKQQEQEWLGKYRCKLSDKIKIFPRLTTQLEVADLISACTAMVQPSRAEGFDLPLIEGLSMKKWAIATNYAAHTEFCTPENSMLINVDKLELARDDTFFREGTGEWAHLGKSQEEQTINYMREIYDRFHSTGLTPNEAGRKTAEKFSWKNSAEKLKMVLDSGR